MKRILLDENIDSFLKALFASGFEVMTVRERGWNGKKNGELLRLAQKEFGWSGRSYAESLEQNADRLTHPSLLPEVWVL